MKDTHQEIIEDELTSHDKLIKLVAFYTDVKIFHPDFLTLLKRLLYAAYEEDKKKATERAYEEAKISKEARVIEEKLVELQRRTADSPASTHSFYHKLFYKDLLKIVKYGK